MGGALPKSLTYLDIAIDGLYAGTLIIEMFEEECPLTWVVPSTAVNLIEHAVQLLQLQNALHGGAGARTRRQAAALLRDAYPQVSTARGSTGCEM